MTSSKPTALSEPPPFWPPASPPPAPPALVAPQGAACPAAGALGPAPPRLGVPPRQLKIQELIQANHAVKKTLALLLLGLQITGEGLERVQKVFLFEQVEASTHLSQPDVPVGPSLAVRWGFHSAIPLHIPAPGQRRQLDGLPVVREPLWVLLQLLNIVL
eukprot:CAMPEP_0204289244 /NCGR_PEP_ID=MMETSP0468-20130131/58274_1 /ASSEMBLY_ACC=CAM_ASM_000383 /TAXON_ID=2969 /ORGANISM="Oxyrrhis marina" /LENGTH=159 /DNA_ID=CAMNT_0051267387 /DNA_START=30 /DNA_END=510 /DNA_ORIENTATION=+